MRLCAIVPTYRHTSALPALSTALRAQCDAVFIIDDGNESPAREAIAALHDPDAGIEVLRQSPNAGKGAAMMLGFRTALMRSFTHALQIDADGQHDIADLPKFIAAARGDPNALICGQAMYDASVPKARKVGRYITHFWVWVETASLDIADSMCGYRIYPLAALPLILRSAAIGKRMDFDTEIAVHLHWRGVRVINMPTQVIYPPGNVSNFAMLWDNVRISLMHTRLVLQALFRLPWKFVTQRRYWTAPN
jgi:glycosyltransferase involved in cell wall biosynthesis